jgi:hypothetical protein
MTGAFAGRSGLRALCHHAPGGKFHAKRGLAGPGLTPGPARPLSLTLSLFTYLHPQDHGLVQLTLVTDVELPPLAVKPNEVEAPPPRLPL